MPTYRTLEPVSVVKDGLVVSVKADREIDLTPEQAKTLAGKVLLIESQVKSMFPDGAPHIPVHIVRPHSAMPIAGEPVEPEPKSVPSVVKVQSQPKPESK